MGGIFGQDAPGVAWLGSAFHALRREAISLGVMSIQFEFPFLGVDGDGIAVLDEGDGTADISFGRDVADDEAVAAAAETAIGDERHVFAKAFAHDGGGGREHFPHAGTAARPFITDDDDVAFDDAAVEDFFERGFTPN